MDGKGENVFYWFEFTDGYRVCARGFDRVELAHEEQRHGKLLRKVPA